MATTKEKWVPLARDYEAEHKRFSIPSHKVKRHPLNVKVEIERKTTKVKRKRWTGGVRGVVEDRDEKEKDVINPLAMPTPVPVSNDPLSDPLSAGATSPASPFADPLAVFSSGKEEPVEAPVEQSLIGEDPHLYFQPWKNKKPGILKKYTTNKRIPVVADFLEEKDQIDVVQVERLKSRVEQLDADPTSESEINFLSQKEYIKHLEDHHTNLKEAWKNGQRVLALKIAIQSAKMLGDTTVPHFYPSMYVLTSDILQTFGDIVFQRIKKLGAAQLDGTENELSPIQTELPDSFTDQDVCASAKEMCRNWFYKTACIRELLPRLYIELALINSYRFLKKPEEMPGLLRRMCRTIRGIGDPLVAAYARAFLASKGRECCPDQYKDILCEAYDDFLFTFREIDKTEFKGIPSITAAKISRSDYVDLYSPALQWLLQNVGFGAPEEVFFALISQTKDCWNNTAVLVHILTNFNPKYISNHAIEMTRAIRNADDSTVPRSQLYRAFGQAIVVSPPPHDVRLQILNEVWKVVKKIQDPKQYVLVAEVFIEFVLQHFSKSECNTLLKDIIKHVQENQSFKELQPELHSIVQKIMKYKTDFTQLFAIDRFLPVVDMLNREMKQSISKSMMQSFAKHAQATADPVIINSLMDVARILHDSLDSLSFADERSQISRLILQFISKIDFGKDLEQQLNMYNDCRRSFTNLDIVTTELVSRVAQLAMKAHGYMHGNHNKKTSAFVKACLAYCHITIPSLDSVFPRLNLFLQCGRVGMMNNLIVQSEAFFKAAISLIPDVPITYETFHGQVESTEKQLAEYILNFASSLLMFPGHPEHGPFYLIKALLNSLQEFEPWKSGTPEKVRVHFGMLLLFCGYSQQNFIYHIKGIASNDQLYGGASKYKQELSEFLDVVINEILQMLSQIGAKTDIVSQKRMGLLALEFVNHLISNFQMNKHSATLVVKLYNLANAGGKADRIYLHATIDHIRSKRGPWYRDLLVKLQ